METSLTPEQLISFVLAFLTLVPMVGGGAGMAFGAFVDLLKAVLLLFKKELPADSAGGIVLLLNFILVVVLYFVFDIMPGGALPDDVGSLLALAAQIFTALATLITAVYAALGTHSTLKKIAPSWVSLSYRKLFGRGRQAVG